MTAKTLSEKVEELIDDQVRNAAVELVTPTQACEDIMDRLRPLLEAADALMPTLADFREDMKHYPLPAEIGNNFKVIHHAAVP